MKHALAWLLGGVTLAGEAAAQDLAAGREVAGQCRTCHGPHGKASQPDAPNIGGEPAAYLAGELRAFRSGRRRHPRMSVIASGLSEAEIADVAAWYAAQRVTATLPEGADPARAPGRCTACHGTDGLATVPEAPNLAGEGRLYLTTQLEAFASGARASEAMASIASALSEAERRAAAEWYAAVTFEASPPEWSHRA